MVRLNGKTGVCWAIGGGLALALAAAALGLLFLAPLLANCFGAQHLWPVLSRGGLQTARQILALILALGRTMAVVLRNLAVPLVLLTTYGVVAAVLLNALWLRILRRLDWSVTAD